MTQSVQRLLGGATAKRYGRGTQRACDPAETLRRLQPHLASFGITRVANVTGLDRIGIPVFMVVRPNSRSLAVSQGKGVDPEEARVSGIMEAIELHHAESCMGGVRLASYAELARSEPAADPESLPLARDTVYQRTHPIPWTLGFDLLQQVAVWVPFELVHAAASVPPLPGNGCFVRSSNGLASGNTLSEAVLHGLCEVIERDAAALWRRTPPERQASRRVDLDTVTDGVCRELLGRFQRAGVSVAAWDITSDIGVAAFHSIIVDTSPDPVFRPIAAAGGYGCHTDRGIALARALTEAAQSRLTAISGSRDDLTTARYRATQSAEGLEIQRRLTQAGPGGVGFDTVPTDSSETVEGDVKLVLDRLRSAGMTSAIFIDLSREDGPASVARAIVPGLEGPPSSPRYRPGRRARASVG